MNNFLPTNEIDVVEASSAAAQTALTGDIVDAKDWEAVTFIALLGDVSDGSVLTLNVEHGDESGGGDMADTTASVTFTAGATDADSKVLALEIVHPSKRYLRPVLTRTTADAVVNGIIAIKHGPKLAPITQNADVLDHDTVVGTTAA